MDSRHIHPSRGGSGGGGAGMPGMPGLGIPPPSGGGLPHHHHLSHPHPPPHHHGPPPPQGPSHYDERDRMGPTSGPPVMATPPMNDPYYGHQQPLQQPHQQHPQHHTQHPQHPQHHQQPPHHAPPPSSHPIQQQTRHYKEHSRSPESERLPQSYRPTPAQTRNDPFTPLSLAARSPAGPPPIYSVPPRSSTPDQHAPSRAPSLTGSPAVYRGPGSHHQPPPPPPATHPTHHPHQSHPAHPVGADPMMNPPPPQHHRGMPPPSSPHHSHMPLQQQPPQQGQQHQTQTQTRPPAPQPSHPSSTPYQGGRDLPSLNSIPPPPPPPPRPTTGMSISAMLDGPVQPSGSTVPSKPPPPPPPPPQPAPEYNQVKRPYTPDYAHQNGDRSRNVSIVSSPGVMGSSVQGYGASGKGRVTPDHTYRPHMPHHPPGMMPSSHGVPPRPVSQPIAPSTPHSLSSVLHQPDEISPRGHVRSASYHERDRDIRDRERERESQREIQMQREREMREREIQMQQNREMQMQRERDLQEREMRERELREREMREREMREREMREREMREREMREREMREREMREREMREREMREREMREREMREREREIQMMRDRELQEQRERRERERLERERMERAERERAERERIDRERERERIERMERDRMERASERERERLSNVHPLNGMHPNSPHTGHHPHQHALPTQSYHSHPMTSTSNPHATMTSVAPPHTPHTPMVSGIVTLPPQAATSNHGPPPTSSSYQTIPFSGYTTTMPPSPFALQPTPSLPPPSEGHDRRRQGYADNQHGRAEDLLYSKQMNERKAAAQSVAQAQIDRKNPLLAMAAGHDMRLENIGPQKPNIMEREKDEDTRVRIKEKERDDDGPQLSMGKRKHHHHHTHHHHTHHHHHDDDRFSLDGGPLHVQTLNPNKRAMTPTVTATHHHHHGPPHRHHSPAPPPAKRPKLIVNNDSVLKSVTDCPRYHLGSMLYQPSAEPKPGYSTTSLLPRFEGRENCIFQIRIPRRYLYERERADVCQRRCLWGTDVYTDDSDILAVLIHLGKIPAVLPEGIDSNLVLGTPTLAPLGKNLEEAGAGRKGRPVTKGKSIAVNGSSNSAGTHDKAGVNSSPSNTYLNLNKDLIVDILILPPLEKYSSTVRNAIKSRAWLKQHDGMSYMVHQIKEVEPGEAEGRGKSMRKQRLNEREHIRKWGTLPGREGEGGLRGVGRDCWEAKVGA